MKVITFSLLEILDNVSKATNIASVSFGKKESLQTKIYCFGCQTIRNSRVIIDYSKNCIKNLMCISCYRSADVDNFGLSFPGEPRESVSAFKIKDEYFITVTPKHMGNIYWYNRKPDDPKITVPIINGNFNETLLEFIQNIELMK